jgi:hydroxymethylpyrimidine pyrophosphatase-like HAD family hydrolase
MADMSTEEEARRILTARCLLAADIDKTIVAQGSEREKQDFLRLVGPQLIQAAKLGTNLAFISGNAMEELTGRFLRWLLHQLCYLDEMELLSQFHFFCNSGGVYVHFDLDDPSLRQIITSEPSKLDASSYAEAVLKSVTSTSPETGLAVIHPRFVDAAYIRRSRIHDQEVSGICEILEQESKRYLREIEAKEPQLEKLYRLEMVRADGIFVHPRIERRYVTYGTTEPAEQATVQITLKPVLSFHQAHQMPKLFGRDLRSVVVSRIQARLDASGLGHYIARPGGRASIDVTTAKLDKAYALEFLIDRLNVYGNPRLGQHFGSNTIYFGDEVIVGSGNDFAVTRIPGLMVVAVNPQRDLVPLISQVLIPSTILEGPDATAQVLSVYNRCAEQLLRKYVRGSSTKSHAPSKTAVEAVKEEIYSQRTHEMLKTLQADVEDWEALHSLVSLIVRQEPRSRRWLAFMMNELNSVLMNLAEDGVRGDERGGGR